jgi:hypothetical protein
MLLILTVLLDKYVNKLCHCNHNLSVVYSDFLTLKCEWMRPFSPIPHLNV